MPVSRLLSTALVGTALALLGAGCVTSISTQYITLPDNSTAELSRASNR